MLIREAFGKATDAAGTDLEIEVRRARHRGLTAADQLVGAVVQGKTIHHARVARILRDWYIECYDAGLGAGLGRETVVAPAAAEIEQQAAVIEANRAALPGRRWPLYVAAGVHRRALRDGAAAAEAVWTALRERAVEWSHTIAPAARSDLGAQIIQQWHRHCYLSVVAERMGFSTPLRRVSEAEVGAVLRSAEAGEAWRIVGADGVPLMTPHNTRTTDLDRRLDAGEVGAQPVPPPRFDSPTLRQQLERRWETAEPPARAALARAAGLSPVLAGVVSHVAHISSLDVSTQGALRRAYLSRLERAEPRPRPYVPTAADRVVGPPAEAAADMFGTDPIAAYHHRAPGRGLS